MLINAPEDMIDFQRYNINSAIMRVQALIEELPEDRQKSHDFYTTIEETLIALSFVIQDRQQLVARLDVMEKLLLNK